MIMGWFEGGEFAMHVRQQGGYTGHGVDFSVHRANARVGGSRDAEVTDA